MNETSDVPSLSAENVHQLDAFRQKRKDSSGGEPPMDDMGQRVAKIEAVLPTLATKLDLADLKQFIQSELKPIRADLESLKTDMKYRITYAKSLLIAGGALLIGLGGVWQLLEFMLPRLSGH